MSCMLCQVSFPRAHAQIALPCCTDLEERISVLETGAARKSAGTARLTVSGWVNEALFFWDDSVEANVYVGTNDLERDRFRFVGEAKIWKDVSAGFVIEIGVRGANSSAFSQTSTADVRSVDLRKSSWIVSDKTYGKLTIGQDGTATYHLLDDADVTKTRNYSDYEAAGVYVGQFSARDGPDICLSHGARSWAAQQCHTWAEWPPQHRPLRHAHL